MNDALNNQVAVIEEETSPLLAEVDAYSIESSSDVENVSVFLKKVSDAIKNVEAKRLEFTKPLNQSLKAINSTFKELKRPLEEAKGVLSTKILDWRAIESKRVEKEEARRRKIQEAHKKQGHEVKAPVVMAKPEKTIGNTQVRKVWRSKVVDFSKVPDEYKAIDQVKVNQAVRSGEREISGIEIYQEETMVVV